MSDAEAAARVAAGLDTSRRDGRDGSVTTLVRTPWRQVPMPDRIARLPRDKRGFPVPWVSCWGDTSHGVGQVQVTFTDPSLGQVMTEIAGAACDHVAGEGVPDLAKLCSGNQIIGMTQRRCDVCGDEIDGTLHFVGATDNEVFCEPPLHLECAVYSLQVCPGISTRPGVGVVVCEGYDMQPEFMVRAMPGEESDPGLPGVRRVIFRGFVEAVTYMRMSQAPGVCMAVHAVPKEPTRISREDFLSLHLDGSDG